MRELSKHQAAVLKRLAAWDWQRDGCLSSPDLSRVMGSRYDGWAYGKLVALEKRGLVERVGETFSGGRTWRATEARRIVAAQEASHADA